MDKKNSKLKYDNRIRVVKKILEAQGYDINENMLILLGEAMTFSFKNINYSLSSNVTIWNTNSLNKDFENIIYTKFNISKRDFRDLEKEELINLIREELNASHVICSIDDELLKDYKTVNNLKIPTIRNLTTVEVKSLNYDNNEIELEYGGDNVEGLIDGRLTIPIDKFLLAAYSNSLPISPNGSGYIIKRERTSSLTDKINIQTETMKSILNFCDSMTGNVRDEDGTYYGILGMKELLNEIKLFCEVINKNQVNNEIINKLFTIRFKILRKTLIGVNNTLYRCEFGDSLKEVSSSANIKDFMEIGKEFNSIGRRWLGLNRVVSIANFRLDTKEEFLKIINETFQSIIEDEEKVIIELKNITSKVMNR